MMAHYSSAPSIELKPTVALTGTGINPPQPTFSPASLAFGNQVAGSTSASQTMTLTNPTGADQPIKIESLVFASSTKSFNQANNCPATLAAGSSCQIQILSLIHI